MSSSAEPSTKLKAMDQIQNYRYKISPVVKKKKKRRRKGEKQVGRGSLEKKQAGGCKLCYCVI